MFDFILVSYTWIACGHAVLHHTLCNIGKRYAEPSLVKNKKQQQYIRCRNIVREQSELSSNNGIFAEDDCP